MCIIFLGPGTRPGPGVRARSPGRDPMGFPPHWISNGISTPWDFHPMGFPMGFPPHWISHGISTPWDFHPMGFPMGFPPHGISTPMGFPPHGGMEIYRNHWKSIRWTSNCMEIRWGGHPMGWKSHGKEIPRGGNPMGRRSGEVKLT